MLGSDIVGASMVGTGNAMTLSSVFSYLSGILGLMIFGQPLWLTNVSIPTHSSLSFTSSAYIGGSTVLPYHRTTTISCSATIYRNPLVRDFGSPLV